MYATLLRENRELKRRLEEVIEVVEELQDRIDRLEGKSKDKKKRLKKPELPRQVKIIPPWEREGMSKREWMEKKKSVS